MTEQFPKLNRVFSIGQYFIFTITLVPILYHVLIPPDLYATFSMISWGVVGSLGVWLFLRSQQKNWKRWLTLIVLPIVLHSGFAQGVPSILHLFSTKVRADVTVTVNSIASGPRCTGFAPQEFADGLFNVVCGLEPSVRNKLSKGDQVYLYGEKSDWAFKSDKYMIVK